VDFGLLGDEGRDLIGYATRERQRRVAICRQVVGRSPDLTDFRT